MKDNKYNDEKIFVPTKIKITPSSNVPVFAFDKEFIYSNGFICGKFLAEYLEKHCIDGVLEGVASYIKFANERKKLEEAFWTEEPF